MGDNFIKEMEEKLSKRLILNFSLEDITKMICIIKCLEKESIYKSNYIKELEEQHKQDCRIFLGGMKNKKSELKIGDILVLRNDDLRIFIRRIRN